MATVAETKHKAGRMLGIVRYGQSLNSSDDALLQEAYGQVYDSLKEDGLATWASTGTVPNKVMPHVAALVAFNCLTDKGVSAERRAAVIDAYGLAMPEIRRLLTPAHESLDEPTDY